MQQNKVAAYLKNTCPGRSHRIRSDDLAKALGMRGSDLRKQIHRLRCQGVPIASDRYGYYYAVTAGEIYRTIRQLKQMAAGLEAAISGLERSLDQFQEGGDLPE